MILVLVVLVAVGIVRADADEAASETGEQHRPCGGVLTLLMLLVAITVVARRYRLPARRAGRRVLSVLQLVTRSEQRGRCAISQESRSTRRRRC